MDEFDAQSYKMDRESHDCGQAQLAPPALPMSVPHVLLDNRHETEYNK